MNQKTSRLTISGLCIALGLVLPFLTGQIPQIGSMLLPMHIPVFLCGLICGWQYGLAVGFHRAAAALGAVHDASLLPDGDLDGL